ncbi:unnamed protein product, partial [Nesidiocoris tenuis]
MRGESRRLRARNLQQFPGQFPMRLPFGLQFNTESIKLRRHRRVHTASQHLQQRYLHQSHGLVQVPLPCRVQAQPQQRLY